MYEDIEFETKIKPDPAELLPFYQRLNHLTTHSHEKLERMSAQTYCFVTARCEGKLIGIARGVTDGLTGRLAECKLDPAFQGPACVTRRDGRIEHDVSGIAREMAERVIVALRESGVERIEAAAHGTEVDFCEELGFRKMYGVVLMTLAENAAAQFADASSSGAAT